MPCYEFQCEECGLRFEAVVSMARREQPRPCPQCDTPSKLAVPSEVAGHFTHDAEGPGPQNTGIHDFDTHVDRVIGQHAKQGWNVIADRVRDKRRIMASEGIPGEQLSRNLDGSYRPLGSEEKGVLDRALAIHHAAMEWQKDQKKEQQRRSRTRPR